ncbi:MAG: hypothetical protein ACD_24C00018G0002 [uncultured bacterium]|nr:MAG: hypothetical protein ACD_24C00018G0002 [uncultured bacterium]OGH14103.1 MAG: hypothetical protein A2687_02450 [Candidatus Levybacteria bacterium RIFCSPHIGHO2_01_FULL_38_26]
MYKKFTRIWTKRIPLIKISKRQKFVTSIVILSLLLFLSENLFGRWGIYIIVTVAVLTDLFLFWAIRSDLKEKHSLQIFILPFFYSLAFGLFYFLVPARFLTRIVMTTLYAFGLYSLFLSQNIFAVSTIRTIALLSSARTVSFIAALVSYFFLSNVTFSLHTNVFVTLFFVFAFSFPLVLQCIWTYAMEKNFLISITWSAILSVTLVEASLILWFFPTAPTIIALFLTGFFYIIVGISQIWLERRLFKNIMWEYVWVAVIVFLIFVVFTIKG